MKRILLLIATTFLAAQSTKVDSTKQKNPFVFDESDAVRTHVSEFQAAHYGLSLFEFHRPQFVLPFGLSPKYSRVYRDHVLLNDAFSGGFDFSSLNSTWLGSANSVGSWHRFTTLTMKNSTPFTRIELYDGDFLYSNADLTFYQRLSEKLGLYFGGNAKESTARGAGHMDKTHIRAKIDYHFSKKESLAATYYLQKQDFSDYGYVLDEQLQNGGIDAYRFARRDDRDHVVLEYKTQDWRVFANYAYQLRITSLTDTIGQRAQRSDRTSIGAAKNVGFYTFTGEVENSILSGNFIADSRRETRARFAVEMNDSLYNISAEFRPLLSGDSRGGVDAAPFRLGATYSRGGHIGMAQLERKIPSVNESYFSVLAPSAGQLVTSAQPYFKGMKQAKNLRAETATALQYSYQLNNSHSLSVLVNNVQDPLFYSMTDSVVTNYENSGFLQFSYVGELPLHRFATLYSKAHHTLNRTRTFEPKNRVTLGLQSAFTIFKNLKVNIDLAGHFLGERNHIYYINYADVFSIDETKTHSATAFATLAATFRLRSATFRLQVNNGFKTIYEVVKGYESSARGVIFGVDWNFYD